MYRRCGEVNIHRAYAVIALQVASLHNVISLGMWCTEVSLEMNIIHAKYVRGQIVATRSFLNVSPVTSDIFFFVRSYKDTRIIS